MTQKAAMRLALRVEGDWWVAYLAQIDTMAEAEELGRVRMGFVMDPVRKHMFMDLMRSGLDDFVRTATGKAPTYEDGFVPAPEHERSGRA